MKRPKRRHALATRTVAVGGASSAFVALMAGMADREAPATVQAAAGAVLDPGPPAADPAVRDGGELSQPNETDSAEAASRPLLPWPPLPVPSGQALNTESQPTIVLDLKFDLSQPSAGETPAVPPPVSAPSQPRSAPVAPTDVPPLDPSTPAADAVPSAPPTAPTVTAPPSAAPTPPPQATPIPTAAPTPAPPPTPIPTPIPTATPPPPPDPTPTTGAS